MPRDMEHLSKSASGCIPALCSQKNRNVWNLYFLFFFINFGNDLFNNFKSRIF